MEIKCPAKNCNGDIYLEEDNSESVSHITGSCDSCGTVINYDENSNGKKVRDYSRIAKIETVEVSLDDDVPEYMDGIIRIGSVKITYNTGKEIVSDELVNNAEFRSENDLGKYVAKEMGISIGQISVID